MSSTAPSDSTSDPSNLPDGSLNHYTTATELYTEIQQGETNEQDFEARQEQVEFAQGMIDKAKNKGTTLTDADEAKSTRLGAMQRDLMYRLLEIARRKLEAVNSE